MFGLGPGDDPRRWTGHPEQVAGVELAEFLEGDVRGVRVLRLRGAEVEVEVLVDRGLDLLRARVRGVPVGRSRAAGSSSTWPAACCGSATRSATTASPRRRSCSTT